MPIIINKSSIIVNRSVIKLTESSVEETIITFGSLVNWQESPTGWWGPIATGANGSGKSAQYLPASTDGYIISDITDNLGTLNNLNTGMGLALSNALTPDYVYDYLTYIEGSNGNYKTYDPTNGYVDSGILSVSGQRHKIERIGDTLYARYWDGASWNLIYTFPNTTTAALYIYGGHYDIGEFEYLVNPKGYNII